MSGIYGSKKNTLKEASEKYQDMKRRGLIPKDKKVYGENLLRKSVVIEVAVTLLDDIQQKVIAGA